MIIDIDGLLKKLKIKKQGKEEGRFYVIPLENSDEYLKMYSHLNEIAINTENPSVGANSSKNVVKITNYFEIDHDDVSYNIFLIANFEEDAYYLKIGEK